MRNSAPQRRDFLGWTAVRDAAVDHQFLPCDVLGIVTCQINRCMSDIVRPARHVQRSEVLKYRRNILHSVFSGFRAAR